MTYADLAKLLDLPPTDDPDLQVRLLQERRAEQLDALEHPWINHPSLSMARVRASRFEELRDVEAFLALAGAPLEPESDK